MQLLKDIRDSLLHLAFPHLCEGCGSDQLEQEGMLCLHCLSSLPETNFHLYRTNPVENIFRGRLPISYATAQYYFTHESMMQHVMHQVKYHGNRELGLYLGRLMGHALMASDHLREVDILIPLPLHISKERNRGFNQAAILCEGITEVLARPIIKDAVIRSSNTESQTKKSRIERWQNMEGMFELVNPEFIEGKHVLLVDDVITTGATLESCGKAILKANNVQLSIAALCISSGN
jgi:ComF family protein